MIVSLKDIASVIRSKNSGPFELTLDMMFKDEKTFNKVLATNVINHQTIANLYKIKEDDVLSIISFPNAYAIKVTIVRPVPSGALGDRDVYGAQQHAPLLDIRLEIDD